MELWSNGGVGYWDLQYSNTPILQYSISRSSDLTGGYIAHRSRHRRHVYGRSGIRRSEGFGGTGEGALDAGGISQGGPGSAHQGGDSAQYGFFVDTRYDRCRE